MAKGYRWLDERVAEARRILAKPSPFKAWVYFLEAAGKVKIGMTLDPTRRAYDIQALNADSVICRALIPFSERKNACRAERALHARFAHLRDHGEWFKMAPELAAFMADLDAQAHFRELVELEWRIRHAERPFAAATVEDLRVLAEALKNGEG